MEPRIVLVGCGVVTPAGAEDNTVTPTTILEGQGAEGCRVVPLMELCHMVALQGEDWVEVERPEGHQLAEVA